MFIGEFTVNIGEKNRIAIPKKLRDELKGKIYVSRGYENCILMLDKLRWENLIREINKRPLLSIDVRDTKRYILGGAHEIEIDNQGRFVLPESIKAYGGLIEKAVFLGVGEWIEIWSYENWNEKLSNLKNEVSDIAERLI